MLFHEFPVVLVGPLVVVFIKSRADISLCRVYILSLTSESFSDVKGGCEGGAHPSLGFRFCTVPSSVGSLPVSKSWSGVG